VKKGTPPSFWGKGKEGVAFILEKKERVLSIHRTRRHDSFGRGELLRVWREEERARCAWS